jgi:hypothetical protein
LIPTASNKHTEDLESITASLGFGEDADMGSAAAAPQGLPHVDDAEFLELLIASERVSEWVDGIRKTVGKPG